MTLLMVRLLLGNLLCLHDLYYVLTTLLAIIRLPVVAHAPFTTDFPVEFA